MAQDFEDHCWKDVIPRDDLATYRTFQRTLKVGPRPGLLAIDLYNVVYRGGAKPPHELAIEYPLSCGLYAWNAIEPTKKLFAACRAASIPIFYTTSARGRAGLIATARQSRGNKQQADDYEIFEAFAPQDGDIVIAKERASGFYGTTLSAQLTKAGVSSLIVTGESTSGCVRASVVDGFSAGYHVTVVEECVYDRAQLTHKVNLFDMHHKYADVMKLDEVLAAIAPQGARAAAE
jgi:nicotinamidase-related amidase